MSNEPSTSPQPVSPQSATDAPSQAPVPPPVSPPPPVGGEAMFWGMKLNLFCMLMYLGMFVPTVGWLAPIIMWATNKDQDASKMIDQHGRNIFNFLISMVIYGFVAFVLSLVTLGIGAFVLYPALGIYAIVVIILSALKANEGQIKPIPLCIRFIK